MAKKSRATFQKREKERARQHKQQDKAQRRLAAKEQRASGVPRPEDDVLASAGMGLEPPTVPAPWEDAHPTE
jgi:hypothetical protein